jgi:hypothetical protein
MIKSKDDALSQPERFKQAARELGCDEDESHFEEKLKKVARHKLKNEAKSSQPLANPQRSRE